ncbi:MAG: ribose 5-phosphate isomerase A, partial [Methanobacteriota archaeon]
MPSTEDLKREAAEAALGYVKSGMVLGLGTGSTARLFLDGVARLVAGGMDLKGVPTSLATAEAAKDLGVPLTSLEERPSVDLAVDGADEVDPKLDLIKGLGGALFREKIVAAAAQQFVVIVDESKLVSRLGV